MDRELPQTITSHRLLTESVYDMIVAYAGKGNPMRTCAQAVGISPMTLQRWLKMGNDNVDDFENYEVPISLFGQFAIDVARAKALWEINTNAKIDGALDKNEMAWPAAMTRLERYAPEEYGRRQTVKVDQKMEVTYNVVTLDGTAFTQRQIEPVREAIESSFAPESSDE